jgi:hypothetical protein
MIFLLSLLYRNNFIYLKKNKGYEAFKLFARANLQKFY